MIKNIYIRTGTNVITSIIGFIPLILIVRTFGSEVWGRVTYYYSLAGVLSILADLGVSTAYTKFQASEDNPREAAIFLFFKVLLILGYAIVFAAAYFFKFRDGQTDAKLLWVMFAVIMLELISQYFIATLAGKRDFAYMSIAEIAAAIALFVYTLFACFVKPDIYVLAASKTVLPLVTIIWGVAYFKKKEIIWFSMPTRAEIMKYVSFSAPIAVSTILGNFISYADKLVLGKLMGLNEVGLYQIAQRCYAGIDKFLKPVTNTLFTEIVNRIANVPDYFHKRFQDLVQLLGFLSGVLVIILIFSSTFVVNAFFGAENIRSAFILKFCAFSVVTRLFWRPYATVIYAIEKHRLVTIVSILGIFVMIGFYYLLIPAKIFDVYIGAAALPIAEFIASLIPSGILMLFLLKRHFGTLGIKKSLTGVWIPLAAIIFAGYFFDYSIILLPVALGLFIAIEFYFGILTRGRLDDLIRPVRKVWTRT